MPKIFDFVIIALVLPLLIIASLIIYPLVYFDVGKGVIFTQLRGGYRGCTFKLYKFRTMNNDRDEFGVLLPDCERITRIGRFLRSTSLDELPSLLNVLSGDMRLVGPRPFIADYLAKYSARQFRRHDVMPGLTGWAQVNGRNGISWSEKFELDLWYVENRTLKLDLYILLLTAWKVVRRENVDTDQEMTMPPFGGCDRE